MNCYLCNGNVIWQSDFDYADYGIDCEGVVHTYCCQECGAFYEVYDGEPNDMREYVLDIEEECENLSQENRILVERIRDLEEERA